MEQRQAHGARRVFRSSHGIRAAVMRKEIRIRLGNVQGQSLIAARGDGGEDRPRPRGVGDVVSTASEHHGRHRAGIEDVASAVGEGVR
jgi:hypothetical protein